jgi:hypothetical protein
LGFLFQRSGERFVTLELDGHPCELSLETATARRQSYATLKARMIPLPRVQRESLLKKCAEVLRVEAPRGRMLSWEDVKELQAAGIEFGAHTDSHPLLARIPIGEAREEMKRSLEEVRVRVGVAHPSFCFPAGSQNPELMALVRQLGFRSVFQPSPPHRVNNLRTANPYSLGRLGLPNAPAVFLEAEVDGPLHPVRRALRTLRKV